MPVVINLAAPVVVVYIRQQHRPLYDFSADFRFAPNEKPAHRNRQNGGDAVSKHPLVLLLAFNAAFYFFINKFPSISITRVVYLRV